MDADIYANLILSRTLLDLEAAVGYWFAGVESESESCYSARAPVIDVLGCT
jgi:hypothetical protein